MESLSTQTAYVLNWKQTHYPRADMRYVRYIKNDYATWCALFVHSIGISYSKNRGHECTYHDVIKWKHFPFYWPFVRGIHRWPDAFFPLGPSKRLSTQSWGWRFETPSSSFWRHCNVTGFRYFTGELWVVFCKLVSYMFQPWYIESAMYVSNNLCHTMHFAPVSIPSTQWLMQRLVHYRISTRILP